jgi:very-short-patch-repair endonuclease
LPPVLKDGKGKPQVMFEKMKKKKMANKSEKINDMHYGSDRFAFQKAEEFRKTMTYAEHLLWEELKNNKFYGIKFRRQHPISRFIVDFYCHKYKLVIELDGEIHDKSEVKINDNNRETELKDFGLHILRFKNKEILENKSCTLDRIRKSIEEISGSKISNNKIQ